MKRAVPLVVVFLLIGALGGFFLGRRGRDRSQPISGRTQDTAQTKVLGSLETSGNKEDSSKKRRTQSQGSEPSEIVEEQEEAADARTLLAEIREALAAKDEEGVDRLIAQLTVELRRNPAALEAVLKRFRTVAATKEGGYLAVALGRIKDPEVEEVAVELVRSSTSAENLAGLDLLDRLDIENAGTRSVVLNVLRADPRPEVVSGALYALHRGVPGPRSTNEVLSVLNPLVAHPDSEVRRRAVIAQSEWAPDVRALAPVLRALRDPSPGVRAAAAYGLGQSRLFGAQIPAALAERVSDENEDWAVRKQAWRALGRFPLDERTHALYQRFRDQKEAVGEAKDHP